MNKVELKYKIIPGGEKEGENKYLNQLPQPHALELSENNQDHFSQTAKDPVDGKGI